MAVKIISVFVAAGNFYKLTIPSMPELGAGAHYADTTLVNGAEVVLMKGFRVENPLVGNIEDVYTDSLSIKYNHVLPGLNSVWFYALTGEVIQITASTIQVHDHASIVTGGPAYGTYFSPPQGGGNG